MTILITVIALGLPLGLAVVGYLRDMYRGVVALAGVLFGVALQGFWAQPLAQDLARRLSSADAPGLLRFASLAILVLSVLVGYGGGLLLPRARPVLLERALGALLGLLTGVIAAGYVLQFAALSNPAFQESIGASQAGKAIYSYLPLVLLAAGALIGAAVLLRLVLGMVSSRRPAPPPVPAKPQTSAPAVNTSVNGRLVPSVRPVEEKTLEKINKTMS